MKQKVVRYNTKFDAQTDNTVETMNTMVENGWLVKCVAPVGGGMGSVIVVYEMEDSGTKD